jgi:hypothetical protein
MNPLNYASLEASKRLVDAGIVLETEYYWIRVANSPMTLHNNIHGADDYYPAPSMAEVLKELPNNTAFLKNKIYYASTGGKDNAYKEFISTNPTDALIDLLVWLKGEGK